MDSQIKDDKSFSGVKGEPPRSVRQGSDVFVCLLPPSMSGCCWLFWRCPQLPGTRQGGLASTQGGRSSTRCCTRAWLLRTSLPRNIYRPPGRGQKIADVVIGGRATRSPVTPQIGWSSYLLYVSVVGPTDKLFQLSQSVCFSQGEDQLGLHVRLSRFLSSHLEEFHQVFPVICKNQIRSVTQEANCRRQRGVELRRPRLTVFAGCVDHLHVSRGVNGFNIRVNGLLDQVSVQLSSAQLAPHCRLVTALRELVGAIQVADVLDQYLQRHHTRTSHTIKTSDR